MFSVLSCPVLYTIRSSLLIYSYSLCTAANVAWLGLSNNHQFDYWGQGVANTLANTDAHNITHGGLGTPDEVRKPTLLHTPDGHTVAVFAVTVLSCHKTDNGTVVWLDSCTCGMNETDPQRYVCVGE
jgi:hypothetical protein